MPNDAAEVALARGQVGVACTSHQELSMTSVDAVIFDYGGVLTTSAYESFKKYELEEGLPEGTISALLSARYASTDVLADVELGRRNPAVLDGYFREALAESGHEVDPRPIHTALFAAVELEPRMWNLVRGLRDAGVATGLLSNSWGTSLYDTALIEEHFQATVISAAVGMRKPNADIFLLGSELLDVPPSRCLFIDDMSVNVAAAEAIGMQGLVHHSVPTTMDAVRQRTMLTAADITRRVAT
jgi:putative hydrolase of the HAD superfamily